MAASTANQKVFVPLTGVLKLQDHVRSAERVIEGMEKGTAILAHYKSRHNELRIAIELLELPIEIRHFNV